MTETLFAVPVIQPPSKVPAWETWDIDPDRLVLIDNTGRCDWRALAGRTGWHYYSLGTNIGVAASWNLARALLLDGWCPPTVTQVGLISSSVYWNRGLSEYDQAARTEGDDRGLLTNDAFHASIWSKRLLRALGRFDENFYPG
jgi:hypothetical protein